MASGTITPVEETLPTIRALNSVSNFLMSNLCGAIVTHSLALVVLFPAHSDAWNFLQQNNTKAEISLGFYAMRMVPSSFSGVGSRLVFPANDPSPAPVVNGFNSLLDIKAEELFPNGSPKMVFLLYPEIKHPEYELVVRIFQRIGVVIHNAQTPGAWTYFKERLHVTHGVVIVSLSDLSRWAELKKTVAHLSSSRFTPTFMHFIKYQTLLPVSSRTVSQISSGSAGVSVMENSTNKPYPGLQSSIGFSPKELLFSSLTLCGKSITKRFSSSYRASTGSINSR